MPTSKSIAKLLDFIMIPYSAASLRIVFSALKALSGLQGDGKVRSHIVTCIFRKNDHRRRTPPISGSAPILA
jgi:hypothetical protein